MADTPAQDRKLGLTRQQVGDRWFTKYDPNLAFDIVSRVAQGETLRKICTLENGMPATTTFYRWMNLEPELRKAYQAAKELSAYTLEEKALDTAEEVFAAPGTGERIRAAQLLIDQLRWSAARRNPREFSDKGSQQIVVPIHIQTSLDVGDGSSVQSTSSEFYTISVPEGEPEGETQKPPAEPADALAGPAGTEGSAEPQPASPEPPEDPRSLIRSKWDPHAPRKRVLTPPEKPQSDYRLVGTESRERKNEADRRRWREQHGKKKDPEDPDADAV